MACQQMLSSGLVFPLKASDRCKVVIPLGGFLNLYGFGSGVFLSMSGHNSLSKDCFDAPAYLAGDLMLQLPYCAKCLRNLGRLWQCPRNRGPKIERAAFIFSPQHLHPRAV